MRKIIAFAGSKGAGKTTALNAVLSKFNNVHESMFAGKLKKICCEVFGFDFSRLDDLAYKEAELDDLVSLTASDIINVIEAFGVEYKYDDHVRPHISKVLNTVREVLQYIGTDVLHPIDQDIHIKSILGDLPDDGLIVITDLRFLQEFEYFRSNHDLEFYPFYIKNLAAEAAAAGDTHKSELDLAKFKHRCREINNTNVSQSTFEANVVATIRGL